MPDGSPGFGGSKIGTAETANGFADCLTILTSHWTPRSTGPMPQKRLSPSAGTTAVPSGDARGLRQDQRVVIPPFVTLRAFEAVGSCGGVRRAAILLSVDHAAVSRHLRTLEQWTGVTLIDRAAGSNGALTERGRAYHERISQALSLIASATQEVMRREDDYRLRLWCAPGLASEWLTGRIGSFTRRHEKIDFELQPSDAAPDFESNEADAYLHYAIDASPVALPSNQRSIEIARPPILAVASPDFLTTAPAFLTPSDLLTSTLLHEANTSQWQRWFGEYGLSDVGALGGPKFWQNHLTLAAARQGQGIALANSLIVSDDLASGRLVAIGDWRPVFLGSYRFTTHRDSWRATAIASFRRWLERAVADR
jgi:DNA-binding transcriptional LysR family regulator